MRLFYKVFCSFVAMLKDKSQFKHIASILGIKEVPVNENYLNGHTHRTHTSLH